MCFRNHFPIFLVAIFFFSIHAASSELKYKKAVAQYSVELEKTSKGPAFEESQMGLATSLLKAGLPFAALKSFEKIINAGNTHSQYTNAIDALSTMANSDAVELLLAQLLMSVYEKDPDAFVTLGLEKRQTVNYILANRLFRMGKAVEARTLAESLQPKHPLYPKAQYILALDALNIKNSENGATAYPEAISHFEAVRKTISASEKKPALFNLRNLASLGIARAYYEQAYALEEQSPERKALSKKALAEYRAIPRFSNAWEHAIFEMGWAYTVLEDYGDALGAVRSLAHPYFTNSYYPEAEILSAIVYWYNCQWDRANRSLKQWNDKYAPIAKSLKDATVAKRTTKDWSDLSDIPAMVAQDIKKDPQYLVFSALIEAMRQEKELLSSDSVLKDSPISKQLSEYYIRAAVDLKKAASNWTDQRLKHLLADLEDMKTRSSIISLETKTAETQWLEEGRQISGVKRSKLARPYVPNDRDQFWWVNNTESWKDELGYYRLSIKSECYE